MLEVITIILHSNRKFGRFFSKVQMQEILLGINSSTSFERLLSVHVRNILALHCESNPALMTVHLRTI